jgi:hypothetical protein
MSRKNNVNPDHYKVAGRARPNEVIPPEHANRDPETINKRGAKGTPNFIPGGAPVGESPAADDETDEKTS